MKTIVALRRTLKTFPSPRKALSLAVSLSLLVPPTPWVGPRSAQAATVPQMISYQGRLTDNLGNPLANNHDFIFSIHDDLAAGNLLWTETQNSVPVVNGVFTVSLGAGTAIPADVFSRDTVYLQVNVDGSDMSPRDRLITVPFAFNAVRVDGEPVGNFVSTTTLAQSIAGSKTFTGPVFVPDPTLAGHAANKTYVDAQVVGGGSGWLRDGNVVKLSNAGYNAVVQSTLTVQGEAFSVGVSTLAVTDGKVGVGTTTPGAKLDVYGGSIILGKSTVNGDIGGMHLAPLNGNVVGLWVVREPVARSGIIRGT